ncbi:hypothetical protein EGW08_021947 [Elysia chlorotica]|uniref:Uncharacterized protein n=1 Tax=Elysia chlorotica TaxID=188477 RepID=A0A433SM70_ELYCH|nr:hypothetical protein EGW08_021947 [Elysia chlorotica]
MGFGILWINPQEVISDSVLIARPSGVCNLTGRPTVGRDMSHPDESQYDKYTTQTHTAVGRMSLGTHPGIFWHNASYVKSNHTMDDKTVPFYSKTKLRNVISWLNERTGGSHETPTSTSTTADGWWPVFCPPTLPKSFFESANSPVGRLNTHYSTVEEFDHMFCNRNINDIKFPSTFTVNPVFTHPFANINSECLYPSIFLNEPGFPLTKYLTFNRTAALAAANMSNAMSKSIKDIFNERAKDNADDDNDGIINYLGMTHNNISHLTGAALPKPCWTTMDLSAGLMSREDFKDAKMYAKTSVVTNGDTGFYITGTHAQGRFERRNVSHFRYPM